MSVEKLQYSVLPLRSASSDAINAFVGFSAKLTSIRQRVKSTCNRNVLDKKYPNGLTASNIYFKRLLLKSNLSATSLKFVRLGIMSTEAAPGGSADAPVNSSENADTPEGASLPTSPTHVKSKVDVLLKPAGDAPIIKKKKWSVERHKKIAYISDFIRKLIKLSPSESIFLYVNQAFAPAPDTEIGNIFDCFGSDGKLVLHYCRTQAWG